VAPRLDAVAREAAKQSRRRFLPRVGGPVPWTEAVAPPSAGSLVVLWERATVGLLDAIPADTPPELALLVGPEGGIPEGDARATERDGAVLASLGPNVLRTETAAVVGAAVVLAGYGRLG
jgi:16S rRNA (uracil1498-N3)-methyltransferase